MNEEIVSTNLSRGRAALALGVAVIADILQLPMNLAMFAGAMSGIGLITSDVPLEGLDVAIDIVTACVTSWLIGFHWTLLPNSSWRWSRDWMPHRPGLAALLL